MALFAKTPTHVKIMNHPIMGWAAIGVLAVNAVSLVSGAANGVAQALRKRQRPARQPAEQTEQQTA